LPVNTLGPTGKVYRDGHGQVGDGQTSLPEFFINLKKSPAKNCSPHEFKPRLIIPGVRLLNELESEPSPIWGSLQACGEAVSLSEQNYARQLA
jgi:hypothetical protein